MNIEGVIILNLILERLKCTELLEVANKQRSLFHEYVSNFVMDLASK
jgi:hypothetical protein